MGQKAFLIGLVLLPCTALFGGIALLVSLLAPGQANPIRQPSPGTGVRQWNREAWAWVLLAMLMLVGAIGARSGLLAWAGLANWLPFFWAFWGFQRYLGSELALKRATIAIVTGTVPVIAVGFLQLVFSWKGPWEALGGLLSWGLHDTDLSVTPRFTGVFSNPNLSGAWLAMVWPLALGLLLERRRDGRQDPVLILISALLAIGLLLSGSRNAIGLGLLAVPMVLGWRCLRWFAPLAITWLGAVWLAASSSAPALLQQVSRLIVPATLWEKVASKVLNPQAEITLAHRSREALWHGATHFLQQLPTLGYGANGFRMLYEAKNGVYINHSHNLPLELVLSHGWLAGGLFLSLVAAVLVGAWRAGISRGSSFNRAWLAATLVTIGLHGWDIPSFDSRHNVLGWVLLAGLQAYRFSQPLLNAQRDQEQALPVPPSSSSAQQ